MTMELKQIVQVNRIQPSRLGPVKHPGRTGIVIGRNKIAGNDHGGLWNVKLNETRRAKERIENFWGEELTLINGNKIE